MVCVPFVQLSLVLSHEIFLAQLRTVFFVRMLRRHHKCLRFDSWPVGWIPSLTSQFLVRDVPQYLSLVRGIHQLMVGARPNPQKMPMPLAQPSSLGFGMIWYGNGLASLVVIGGI